MQERPRKIWKQKHQAQSPTAMFWSLGCRPVARATPVMPTRSPSDKLRPESHTRRLTTMSMTCLPAHAASHWVLPEPWGQGSWTRCLPRLKRTGYLPKVTLLTAKSQDSNPSLSDFKAQALNPTMHVPFPPPFPFPGTSAHNALMLWGKLRGVFFFFFKRKLKKN